MDEMFNVGFECPGFCISEVFLEAQREIILFLGRRDYRELRQT